MPLYCKNGKQSRSGRQIRPSFLDGRHQPTACDAVGRGSAMIWMGAWIQDTERWPVSPPSGSSVRLPSRGWYLERGARDRGNDNAANEMFPAIHQTTRTDSERRGKPPILLSRPYTTWPRRAAWTCHRRSGSGPKSETSPPKALAATIHGHLTLYCRAREPFQSTVPLLGVADRLTCGHSFP
jgi:hypothetical protein